MPGNTALLSRARQELDLALQSIEEEAVLLDNVVKNHVHEMRKRLFLLGPNLFWIREKSLYSLHPQNYDSFEQWLSQAEIGISLSMATDLINWWIYATPQIEAAGMTTSDVIDCVDQTKMRLMVPKFRAEAEQGHPMSPEDTRGLIQVAANETWEGLRDHLRPSGAHAPEEEENLVVQVVRLHDDRYQISANLSDEQMRLFEKRNRPTWVDKKTGVVLKLPEKNLTLS